MFAVTDHSPGLTEYNVCFQPLIGFHTLFPIFVADVVPVMGEYLLYGPHDPFAAVTVQASDSDGGRLCDGVLDGAGPGAALHPTASTATSNSIAVLT
jgi:hypothetical protein